MFSAMHFRSVAHILRQEEDKALRKRFAARFANYFQEDSSSFNRKRFLSACCVSDACKSGRVVK